MEAISWTDLDSDEQRALEMLGDGVSKEFCAAVTLLTLRRIDLSALLTSEVEKLIRSSLREMSAR
jgi:hypothetical protein